METAVKKLFNDYFFVSLGSGSVSFSLKKRFDNIHFTLSFDPRSSDINFHITRHAPDEKNKPQIVIAKANKLDLESKLIGFSKGLFPLIYEPLVLPKFRKLPKRGYKPRLDYMEIGSPAGPVISSTFETGFHQVVRQSAKGKSKVKINPAIVSELENWTRSKHTQKLARHRLLSFAEAETNGITFGYLSNPAYSGPVILINGIPYRQRENINLITMANSLFGVEKTKQIICKTKAALRDIRKAENYEQSVPFSDPVILFQ